jgi:putative peptide zinc metalloprotease protein
VNGGVDARKVLMLDDGRFIKLSAEAHLMYDAFRRGDDVKTIGAALSLQSERSYTSGEIERAIAVMSANLEREKAKARARIRLWRFDVLPATWVNAIAQRLTWSLHPAVAWCVCAVTLAAVLESFATNSLHGVSASVSVGAYALAFATIIAHELGHATACRSAGERAGAIGITVFFMFPALYTDVSQAWLLARRHRLTVDIAGVYFQLPFVALFAADAALTHSSTLFLAEMLVLGGMLLNLNPVFRFDGYWFLADALDLPNLAREPLRLIQRLIRRDALMPGRPRWHVVVVLFYGLLNAAAWAYAVAASVYVLARRPADVIAALRLGALHPSAQLAAHFGLALMSIALLGYGLITLARSAAAVIQQSLLGAHRA